jgi:multisubunit Na+/H+ antiporter MnhG subunit
LALLSKESAIITPLLIVLVSVYLKLKSSKKYSFKLLIEEVILESKKIIPFIILTAGYLYFRIFHYGLASGDSYIWDFSPRVINTLFWYGLWSFNLPELLVDFIGPGININPNLFKYWSNEIIPVVILFASQIIILLIVFIKNIKKQYNSVQLVTFGAFWFIISLLPVMFLPLHKFSFYLTIALVGVIFIIVNVLKNAGRKVIFLFCFLWLTTSFLTLKLTENTHWITRGAQTAKRVDDYFRENEDLSEKYNKIVFVDTDKDNELPWKPTEIVKASLSDRNYFEVFHPGQFEVYYGNENLREDAYIIGARQFIGY